MGLIQNLEYDVLRIQIHSILFNKHKTNFFLREH